MKRSIVFGTLAALGVAGATTQAAAGSDWTAVTPAQAGFRADIGEQLDAAVKGGKAKNLHAVVVVRGGKLVLERYYEGADQFWAMPIGNVKFDPQVKHDLRSATKSVVGLLYGIALAEGKVPAPDQPLLAQFPGYKDLASDPRRQRMRVEHALSMTLGMDWPEDIPYTDSRNPELGMYLATDPYRFIFDRAMKTEPGKQWNYNGGATALLGHLIAKGTGKPLFAYANDKLFAPLGIVEVQWVGGTNGEVSAASGLRMIPRDFAKLGQLVLNSGRWGNRQLVPAEWLAQVMKPHATVSSEGGDVIEYGYQWWLVNRASRQPWRVARGNGGQTLFIVPSLDLVVAVMAGNYNMSEGPDTPIGIMRGVVLPSLQTKQAGP